MSPVCPKFDDCCFIQQALEPSLLATAIQLPRPRLIPIGTIQRMGFPLMHRFPDRRSTFCPKFDLGFRSAEPSPKLPQTRR